MKKLKFNSIFKIVTILGLLLIILLPNMTAYSLHLKTESKERINNYMGPSRSVATTIPYDGGNGHDDEALAWSNINEMKNKWGQYSGESHESFLSRNSEYLRDVVIAIIDDGITRDMWNAIEATTNCEIEVYVNWHYDDDDQSYLAYTTSDSRDVETTETYLPEPHVQYDNQHSHGSMIAWIISQAANGVKLWILDVYDEERDYQNWGGFEGAYDWLYDHMNDYSGLDIVSMSYGYSSSSPYDPEKQKLEKLQDKGIMLLAAAGNSDDHEEDSVRYPRSYPVVWGVGAHYDESDNYLTDGQFFDDSRYRISKESCQSYRSSSLLWASSYKSGSTGESVDFLAPGFDYETQARDNNNIVIDGTSFSCPHAASIAAYAVATCNYGYDYSRVQIWSTTYDALKKAAERSPYPDDQVGWMYINSAYSSNPTLDERVGYGSIDAYDTIRYLLGGEMVPGTTSIFGDYYGGSSWCPKSTTKVDIFKTGTYRLRANFRINGGTWQTSELDTTLSPGRHDISCWLTPAPEGATIDVWWELVSPTTGNTLNAQQSVTSEILYFSPVVTSDSHIYLRWYWWTRYIDSQMVFKLFKTGYYNIKVEFCTKPLYGGSWSNWNIVRDDHNQYFSQGTRSLWDYKISSAGFCNFQIRWTISDSSTGLGNSYAETFVIF